MTTSEFEPRVIIPLKEKGGSIDGQRIALAYQDVIDMATLAQVLESNLLMSGEATNDRIIVTKVLCTRLLVVMLKAIYMLADIYISTFLHEALGRPVGGMSLLKFLRKQKNSLASRSAINSILSAYCLVAYRNKIIAHQDLRRTYSYEIDHFGHYRLAPLPDQLVIAEADVEELKILKEKHRKHIPGLATEQNLFVVLQLLHYGVPFGKVGTISNDRQAIDAIAERGGCPSMTRSEILKAMDDFSLAIISA